MMKKESQNFKLKLKLPAILRAPFTRRGKKKAVGAGEDQPRSSGSSYEIFVGTPAGVTHPTRPSSHKSDNDDTPSPDSKASTDAKATLDAQDMVSTDGRSHSPALSHRHSMSKATSGENVRVSISVETIKQQLSDGLQSLAEFKKSLRPSSDVQRYDDAVGSFEGAAKGLATLKNKLSNRRLAGNVNSNRASIPGIEESQKETGLGVVKENKETEDQEEEERAQPHSPLNAF
ncbi:hypothetical protein Agabi119p4_10073 [Agaricus bisporus var. burnettii]|uniref:Uncharacterized protein n=1 Tax=Agaricus bisporus var. burnettii TaxID=192524 RepID=A0A8H7C0U5_AGABI|nr:hypothetical protein Agabi119p4_10073 [Agaricus bisporus var. burnettii]